MLVSDKDALTRLNSADNLINKLKDLSSKPTRDKGMNIFMPAASDKTREGFNPFNHRQNQQSQGVTPNSVKVTEITVSNNHLSNLVPRVDDLLDNADTQLKLQDTHNKALEVLANAVQMMGNKLDDIKPDKLPSVIAAASKTVESIRKEKIELNKGRKDQNVHFHFYEPERKQLSDYQTIDV